MYVLVCLIIVEEAIAIGGGGRFVAHADLFVILFRFYRTILL